MKQVPESSRISQAWNAHRSYLVDLAFRMLGDVGAAEDVVQDAFSRLFQDRANEIEDERGWLIVVTSRLCLDQIKSARSRRERAHDIADLDPRVPSTSVDPADRVTLDDSLRLAFVVVLERLSPAERVVFVLHDIFQTPFDVIAETVGKTPANCRQLARRARQKLETAEGTGPLSVDPARHQEVTQKFIAACSGGEMDDLLAVLDPQVTGTIDIRDVVVIGANQVAPTLLRFWGGPTRTLVSQPVGGQHALLGFSNRELAGVLLLTIEGEVIRKIHLVADPVKLGFVRSQLSLAARTAPGSLRAGGRSQRP